MANIANLAVQMTANTGNFTGGLTKASKSLRNFKAQSQADMSVFDRVMSSSTLGSIAAFAGVGSAAVAAERLVSFAITGIVDSYSRLDTIGDVAPTLNFDPQQFAALDYAARISDVENFTGSMEKFQQVLADAFHQSGPARNAFAELGLDPQALALKPTELQLLDVSDAFAEMTNPIDKARLAVDLFGKANISMRNLVEQGSEAIREMSDEAIEKGIAPSNEDIAAVGEAAKEWEKLKAAMEGSFNESAKFAPFLSALTKATNFALPTIIDFGLGAVPAVREFSYIASAMEDADSLGKALYPIPPQFELPATQPAPSIPLDMLEEGRSLMEEAETAGEKLQDRMERLNELLDAGAIGDSTFDRMATKYQAEFDAQDKNLKAENERRDRADQIIESSMSAQDRYSAGVEEINSLFSAGELTVNQYDAALRDLQGTLLQSDPAFKSIERLADRAGNIFEATRTPLENFQAQMDDLQQLKDMRLLDSDTFGRAVNQAQRDLFAKSGGSFEDALGGDNATLENQRNSPLDPGEFKQVTNTSRLALGGSGPNDPQRQLLATQQTQITLLRDIAHSVRSPIAVAG